MRRRRQAQTEDAIVDSNVDAMLSAGVIEHGEGAWGFPVVLVRKKDGSVRFCVDYRSLNSVTRRDVYPLPRIDETLESLGGARLFTTLDLRSGYWQIRVAEEDRDKTAFMIKRGLYRFRRMPFGLTNAPATLQPLMNGVLRGLTWMTCLVYLDDIIIFTKGGIEQHVIELAGVLERLRTAGLSLKLKKCTFATTSMEYLGHHLSNKGVQPAERKFIAVFGSIVEPMTRLLKKDVQWGWSEAQEFAFERVKMLLTTRPLLLYPNFELPFRLVTDASKVGLGACLMQDHGYGWQPIAYGSKVNSAAESNYSITELECLAVVWSVKLFRPYMYGRAFAIITDHAALKWLMTRPNLAGRLHRRSLVLQEYEFQVEYRPGSTNVVADALSRAPAVVRTALGRQRRHQPATAMVTDAEDATPAQKTDGSTTTVNDTVVEPSNDVAVTTSSTMAAQGDGMAIMTTTDGSTTDGSTTTVNDGRAMETHEASSSTILAPIANRKRTKKAAEPGTRRSARIRERTERHVHWATAASVENYETSATPGAEHPAAPGNAPRTATDTIDTTLNAGRGTTTTATTRVNRTDVTMDMQDASTVVEPRTTTMETTGTSATASAAPAAATLASRVSGPPASRSAATRGVRREVMAPPTHGEKTATMRKAPTVSTKAAARMKPLATAPATEKHPTRGVTKANTTKKVTATTGVSPMTQNVENNAVVMTNGADDLSNDEGDAPMGGTLQMSDDELMAAQRRSKFVKRLITDGRYGSMKVETKFGLVTIETANGWRVVLPPTLWSMVFKEMHGTVWSGHLRGPHTYGRVA
ncbi:unnamed protein product [Phytophthora fragariaefolia]|uniref:Unnamed protein product n=1 Tax=Phytophthora fragariaefolia TaxID=1490495 RepID=A0A9W7CUW1_9STRA|nr:unnamed protein product [Phytophthora fragariaefolia]